MWDLLDSKYLTQTLFNLKREYKERNAIIIIHRLKAQHQRTGIFHYIYAHTCIHEIRPRLVRTYIR